MHIFRRVFYLPIWYYCNWKGRKEGKVNGSKSISLTLTDNGEVCVLIGGLYTEKLKS